MATGRTLTAGKAQKCMPPFTFSKPAKKAELEPLALCLTPLIKKENNKDNEGRGVQRCATGFVMLPCRGISSPRDRSDAQSGSSG